MEIKALAAQIKTMQQNRKRAGKRAREQGENTLLRLIVLAVYVASEQSVELAAQCWCMERQRRRCEGECTSLARGWDIVAAWVASASVHDFAEARSPVSDAGIKAGQRAKNFLDDISSAVWCNEHNQVKGHAPTTHQLWSVASRASAQPLAGASGGAPALLKEGKALSSWGARWRRRWFFKYGKIRPREHHDVADLRAKAGEKTVCPK